MKVTLGMQFGRLTVVERIQKSDGRYYCRCICNCGTETTVYINSLTRGATQSCGCLKLELLIARSTTHGYTTGGQARPIYAVWQGMLARCYYKKHISYKNYGAIGVRVCSRWRRSFIAFITDMGERPSSKHMLDRIDGKKGYCKTNCRWVTRTVQNRNKRNNCYITAEGRTLTLQEWAKELQTHPDTIRGRIARGWPSAEAVTTPSQGTGRKNRAATKIYKASGVIYDPKCSRRRKKAK